MSRDERSRDLEELRQRYLDGAMDAQERRRFEEEILASDAEAEEIWAELDLRSLEEERRRQHEVASTGPTRSRRIPRRLVFWPAAMAAAAALVLWFQTPTTDDLPVFRDTSTIELRALRPVGEVSQRPSRFSWTTVAHADSYRFELYDGDSRRQLSRTTADTLFQLPDTIQAPASGYWTIVGMDDVGLPLGEPVTSWYEWRP